MATVVNDPAAMPKLKIDGLCKKYGEVTALEPTRLDVPVGEFLTLLGPSGSGKTTLLQMICGLVEPTSGRIVIDGRDQTDTPVYQRDIGLVFQHYALFPHLTVAENIEFPLRMRSVGAADRKRRVKDALSLVQLDDLGDRFPRELSGGQQQRVALARSFVYQPSVILMDEPLGALDKKLREHMQIEIKQLHRETGATIIYVTHDQEEALALSDRICLMNHSRIEQLGTPQEIYGRPATAFAADFIGISNIFRGKIGKGSDGEARLLTTHGEHRLPGGGAHPGSEAAIVIRPEQMSLGSERTNTVTGRVADTVYAGSETRLMVDIEGGGTVIVRLAPRQAVPSIGETATFSWYPDDAVLIP